MKKEEYINNLIDFIGKSTCSFTCIREIKKRLDKKEYKELHENEKWNLVGNKFYVIRNW